MSAPHIRQLGLQPYESVWQDMQDFTLQRDAAQADEFWLVEHPPVFTLGLNGKDHHILAAGDIPLVKTDRGGQVTYHGPGQQVVYLLVNIDRLGIGVNDYVFRIEQALIDTLADLGLAAERKAGAPGVYINGAKVAALGLRVKKGCSYHGLSLNLDMDLEPFSRINPCGYAGQPVCQLRDLLAAPVDKEQITLQLLGQLQKHLYGR